MEGGGGRPKIFNIEICGGRQPKIFGRPKIRFGLRMGGGPGFVFFSYY